MSMTTYLNPLDQSTNITLSNNNLTFTGNNVDSLFGGVRANRGAITGKWYWEVTVNTLTGTYMGIGIADSTLPLNNSYGGNNVLSWQNNGAAGGYGNGWTVSLTTYTVGDIIGICLDLNSNAISFWKNSVFVGGYGFSRSGSTVIYPYLGKYSSNITTVSATINFGSTKLTYAVPTGYSTFDTLTFRKYLIQQGTDIYSVKSSFCNKIGSAPATEVMFLNQGADDVHYLTDTMTQQTSLGNSFSVLGSGQVSSMSFNSDYVSMSNVSIN